METETRCVDKTPLYARVLEAIPTGCDSAISLTEILERTPGTNVHSVRNALRKLYRMGCVSRNWEIVEGNRYGYVYWRRHTTQHEHPDRHAWRGEQ